jgi:hypothetical protein
MADISNLPVPPKSDISNLPVPPSAPKEKSADYGPPEWLYGGARGAVKSIASFPGEVEKFIPTQVLPKAAVTAPLASTMLYTGREIIPRMFGQAPRKTAAPTSEEVSQILTSLGQEPPKTPLGKTSETVGEFIPVGKGLLELGKAGVARTPLKRLLPGATEKAKVALKPLGEVATDESRLGEQMKINLENRLSSLRTSRSAEAETAKKLYFAKAAGKEGQVLENYNNFIKDELTNNIRNLSPAEKKLLIDSSKRLQGNPSIEAIEKELRYLKDMADTPRMVQGYESIPVIKAGELAKKLENFLPQEGKVFRQKYKEMSEPVNIFDTLKGRKAVGEETDPATLPKTFFKTKDSVRRLRQLTQNEDEVRKYANQHTLNELSSLEPKKAIDWYNNNKIWLEEIKPTNEAVKQYIDELKNIESMRSKGKAVGYTGAFLVGASAGWNKLKTLLGGF